MEEITPSHQAYWNLAKAFKSKGYEPTPAFNKPDNTVTFDDQNETECLDDSIERHVPTHPPTPPTIPDREGSLLRSEGRSGFRLTGRSPIPFQKT
ncbi:hypothetical protein EVAR_11878_1 [Eumeta japonica]|uniref:Uncharacterized protein n=1 Tax=Eumeta variegata TaxID=151549 RepID=A0A4C1U7K5_EUMVA|nr:hypothetical protein EVAR_11878_1 [Eumeta japonica]